MAPECVAHSSHASPVTPSSAGSVNRSSTVQLMQVPQRTVDASSVNNLATHPMKAIMQHFQTGPA